MSKFTIKRDVNYVETDIAVCDSLEYTGTWMGECFLTVSVKSAAPIDFHIGDYIVYRGEIFIINYDPSVIKKARRDTYGEGFTYDGIKFNARQSELTDIMFLDYVLNDNSIHYTSLPTFPFFANDIEDFCDRLQANTGRWCGEQNFNISSCWMFVTPNLTRWIYRAAHLKYSNGRWMGFSEQQARRIWNEIYGEGTQGTDTSNEKKNISVSVNNQTIWNSMSLIKNDFGLNFIVRDRKVIIGSAGLPTTHLFRYGKGNGLSQIERHADTEQQVITKLYGYGSEKNMPVRYYANIGMRVYGNVTEILAQRDNTYFVRIDIPFLSKYFTKPRENGTEDEAVTYAVRVTNEQQAFANDASVYAPSGNDAEDVAENVCEMTVPWSGTMTVGTKIYFVSGVNKDNWDAAHKTHPQNLPNNMAVNCLMLPGFPNQSLYAWVIAHGGVAVSDPYNEVGNVRRAQWTVGEGESAVTYDAYFSDNPYRPFVESLNSPSIGVREAIRKFDGSDDEEEIYPTIENTQYDHVYSVEMIKDNGIFDDNVDTVSNFWLKLPIFPSEFDLEDLVALGDSPTISMKDGYCAGRSFKIASVKMDNGRYECSLEREYDDLLQIYFPYSDSAAHGNAAVANEPYQVRANDKYVFIGIPMTDTYINEASKKLLEKTLQYLQANDYVRYTYLPKVDEIWMAREHEENAGTEPHVSSTYETIKEGDLLHFKDTDLELEDAMVFIDTLNIKENGNSNIPTFDITLRNDKTVGTMQRLQNQINSLSGSGTGTGGYSSNQINNIVKGLGSDLFISKVKDDIAKGKVDFQKAIQIGRVFDSGLLGYGGIFRVNSDGTTYLEVDQMYVRMKAYFDSVEIRKYEHSSGNRIASPAGLKCCKVVRYGEFEGNTVALDDDGYYHYTDQETEEEVTVHCDTIFFRCYYRAKDGEDTKENDYVVGDMAQCRIAKVDDSLNMRYFWRLVVGKNADENESTLFEGEFGWIDLSNVQHNVIIDQTTGYKYDGYATGSDVPQAGDDIFQLGNVRTRGRQGAIIEYTSGNDAPSYKVYQEIGKDDREEAQKTSTSLNPYTLTDKNFISIGYNSATGRADMKVWGDMFIGAKADPQTGISPTFIEYNSGTQQLRIKAILDLLSPLGNTGNSLGDFLTWNEGQINALLGDIASIQQQIDGSIETWFYNGAPSYQVQPESVWYAADHGGTASEVYTERLKHLGDLYYDNASGRAYRYSNSAGVGETPVFFWNEISDSAVIEALRLAAHAQDTADHKRRIFVTEPPTYRHDDGLTYAEYDVGDLWVNAVYPAGVGTTYNNDILRCVSAKPVRDPQTGEIDVQDSRFSISDWDLASKYTDDSRLIAFLDGYQGTLTTIRDQVDKKAETWYQNTDPQDTWYNPQATPPLDNRSEHVGDLWYCTADIIVNGVVVYGKGTTWYYQVEDRNGTLVYFWQQQDVPQQVFDDIDGKAAIYASFSDACTANTAHELNLKDLLIPLIDTTDGTRNVTYIANKLYRCTNLGTDGYSTPLFEEIAYTDDSRFNAYINTLLNGNPSQTADPQTAAAVQYAIKNALGGGTVVDGGLLLTSLIGMRKFNGGDPALIINYTTWAGISGVYDDWSVTHAKGHGIAAWYGGAAVDLEDLTQTQQAAYDALSDAQKAASADYAKSLLRFDGSGYLASGNITWDANGIVTIANVYANIGGSSDVSITTTLQTLTNLSNALPITLRSGTPYLDPQYGFTNLYVLDATSLTNVARPVATQYWVQNNFVTKDFFEAIFKPEDSSGNRVATNGTTTNVLDRLKILVGAYTDKYLSALGLNPNSGGGGGGGTGDVTWTALASAPTGGRTINYGYISAAVSAQGFATQSWVLSKNYLTAITSANVMSALGFTITGTAGNTYNLSNFLTSMSLSGLTDTAISSLNNGQFLVYDANYSGGAKWKNASLTAAMLNSAYGFTITGTASGSYNLANFLTTHQTIYKLSIYGGTTKVLDYTPNSAAASIYIKAGGDVSLTNDTTNKYITLSYSHPTNGANTTISAANGKVLSAITVNNLGHVTSVSSKTLAAADIPDISATYATSSRVTTLEGYFTNGVANNAARLTTVSKTAWGQTYWTANGVPDSISGSLSSVTDITMSGLLYMANGQSIQFKDSGSNYRNVLTLNSLNDLAIGYGTRLQGYVTDIQGGRILFGVGTTRVEAMEITSAGQVQIKQGTQGLIVGNGTTGDYIQIGAIRIEYDNSNNNNALKIYKVVNGSAVAANLYALGGISALGYGLSSGGGGGTGDVTWEALASTATNNRHIDWSYISAALANRYLPLTGGQVTGDLTVTGNLIIGSNIAATRSWVSSSYLPLTGGTISALSGNSPLTIKPVSGQSSYINFADSNGNVMGKLGVNNGVPRFYNQQTSTSYDIWHYGNFPVYIGTPSNGQVLKYNSTNSRFEPASDTAGSGTVTSITAGTGLSGGTITSSGTIAIDSTYQTYISHGESAYNSLSNYLPLSGGTMSGSIYFPAVSAAYNGEGIRFKNGTTESVRIGADTGGGLGLYAVGSIYIRPNVTLGSASTNGLVISSAAFTYNGNNVLTSSNSSVSKSGETLSVTINGTTQSLTNTWRGITDTYNPTTADSSISLSQTGASNLYNAISSTYLKLAGGTMTGDITMPTGFQAYDRGIKFGTYGCVGYSSAGGLGLYASDKIYIRPDVGNGYNAGLIVARTSLTYNGNNVLDSSNLYGSLSTRYIVVAGVPYLFIADPMYTSDINLDSTYLRLSGGTMTGDITMSSGKLIRGSLPDAAGYSILQYSSGGNIIGACGDGTTATIGTYIRSTGDNLYHRKGNTASSSDYRIWDAGNSNLSTVDWVCLALTTNAVVNITGSLNYSEGIRLHHVSGLSSVWFGAVNNTGYDAGMWGISVNSNGMRFRGAASTSATSPTDYINILHGGNVGIGKTDPNHKLEVAGNISLYSASGDSPYLYFSRGTSSDSQNDWRINVVSGALVFNMSSNGTWSSTPMLQLSTTSGTGWLGGNLIYTSGNLTYATLGLKDRTLRIDGTDYTITSPYDTQITVTTNNVYQALTTSANTNVRPVLVGDSNSSSATPTFSSVTSYVYATHSVFIQPSTGNLYLYTPSGDSPALYFQRGDFNTSGIFDWRMYVTAGHFHFQNDSGGWNSMLELQYTGYAYLKGHLLPQATLTYNLGDGSHAWTRTYTRYVDTPSGYSLRLCTSGTERMYIETSNGNVGIGNISPSYKLHVSGALGITGLFWGAQGIELNTDTSNHGTIHGGYISFHYNGANTSNSGFTSRILETDYGIVKLLARNSSDAGKLAGFHVGEGYNGSYIQIGDIRIGYDSTNNALKVYKIVNGSESVANLYALGGISALGYGSSGGSGTVGDVTWSALSSSSDTRQIASSHLTTALSPYVLTTSLSDYLSKSGGTMQSTATINWSLIGTENPSLYIGKHTRSGISSDLVFSLRTSPSHGVTNDVFYVTTGGKLGVSGGFELNCLAELKDNINVYYGGVKRLYFYTPSTNVNILQVTGYGVFSNTVTATNFITSSDTRKKDIIDYDANIDLWSIAYAPAIHFTWKNSDDKSVQVGSIAQYWKSVFPNAVKEGYDGYLSMQYDVLALLSAISIAKKTIDHERRISELERENELLRYEIDKLKAA